ncbi:MAG: hypothetical protein AB7V42_08755 [Thermoleophilia bacterium]
MTTFAVRWIPAFAILAFVVVLCMLLVPRASGESASSSTRAAQAGLIDAGEQHTCAILGDRTLRCWGMGLSGRLGYGDGSDVLSPASAGPVNLGGRGALAVAAGDFHTCAILDDGTVHCWGYGPNGRLGYGAGDANVYSAAAAPALDLGGRRATAITAGASHTCAILDDGSVRCWGNGNDGRLGYGNTRTIGDDETTAGLPAVDLGGHRAVAISAGEWDTCAILDDGTVRCWGFNGNGQLGYGTTASIGDDETPNQAGPVPLPRPARAIAAGTAHTCAVLDDGTVRCWGYGADGRLGYGNLADIPNAASAPPVSLGRPAVGVSASEAHTCAVLDDGAVRCWGYGGNGRLGYGNTALVGDDEVPTAVAPVNVGGPAVAVTAGTSHTCASLGDGTMRCWGLGANGRLGYGNETNYGDNEAPATAGPVLLGGGLSTAFADLRVAVSQSASALPLNGTAQVAVTVTNLGPDATGGVVVSLPPPAGLAYVGASATQGSFGGGTWTVGGLGPGASATLTVTVRATAPGGPVLVAEVAASSVADPTSTPGNGAAEDDRGAAAFTVAAPAPPDPRTDGAKRSPRGVSVKVTRTPKRGVAKRLSVTGTLLLPTGRPVPSCTGKVQVRAMVGKKVAAASTPKVKRVKGVCRYTATLKPKAKVVKRAKVVTVTARYLGSAQLLARAAKAKKVRIR